MAAECVSIMKYFSRPQSCKVLTPRIVYQITKYQITTIRQHGNSGARNPMISNPMMSTETAVAVPNLINGEWTTSSAAEMLDVINPATGEVIARTPLSSRAEVGLAVKAAADAFPAWRRTPPEDRIQYLFKLKMLLEEHVDDLGRIITQENGKTFAEGRPNCAAPLKMLKWLAEFP